MSIKQRKGRPLLRDLLQETCSYSFLHLFIYLLCRLRDARDKLTAEASSSAALRNINPSSSCTNSNSQNNDYNGGNSKETAANVSLHSSSSSSSSTIVADDSLKIVLPQNRSIS